MHRAAKTKQTAHPGESADEMYVDTAVVGGGLSGLATAARLQAAGQSTVVLEAHSLPGGCAGYFRRKAFAFDVGATTLVDFERGGVGGELLDSIGMIPPETDLLPGYTAWLPDRTVMLNRHTEQWHAERLALLGNTKAHRDFWNLMDRLAEVFWEAARRGIALPIRRPVDAFRAAQLLPPQHWHLARYLFSTMGDTLRHFGLREDKPLVGLLSMLVEDTVHAQIDAAPVINAALGITIRGAGLSRAKGGMSGFMPPFVEHYTSLGGRFMRNCEVTKIRGEHGDFELTTKKGVVRAAQVVSALPAPTTAKIGPAAVQRRLASFVERDAGDMGGAIVVFLGVPDDEVADHDWTHHQVLIDYDLPLGVGNNMFISVSAPGDTVSAPAGHRAVMVSTHCELDLWKDLNEDDYRTLKHDIASQLIEIARTVYPRLGTDPVVFEVATPRTYARFARRPGGAVGGVRLGLRNSNLFAIPHDIGVDGFHLVGDSTWPGLGTVACVLGSRIVADNVLSNRSGGLSRRKRRAAPPEREEEVNMAGIERVLV